MDRRVKRDLVALITMADGGNAAPVFDRRLARGKRPRASASRELLVEPLCSWC